MLVEDVLPAGPVEHGAGTVAEMLLEKLFRLVDHLLCDHRTQQVSLQDVLQAEEQDPVPLQSHT